MPIPPIRRSRPGAFDLLGLQVSQTTSDVYIRAKIRNLASTFGSNFGAQLLDVYVRDPAAASHSTTAAFAQRNYTIAPVDAWSERLEAQGFSFGVCTSGASSPICSVDPSTVPKVMDTVTPAGVSQGAELDPTHGPVSLQGVAVP